MQSLLTRRAVVVCFFAHLFLGACECEERLVKKLADLVAEPNPVDFGEVVVSTVKSMGVTLTNRGTATVWLHELSVTEDNREDFSLEIPPELELPHAIEPGNQVMFTVFYHPQDYPENDEGFVFIKSTDREAPEYDLPLLGIAVEPILLVQPNPVDFGPTRVMSTAPATLTITHTGSDDYTVTINSIDFTDDAEGDFVIQDIDELPLDMNPGDVTKVHLSYTPQAITFDDFDRGQILIASNAESQEEIEVGLIGSGYAPHIVVDTSALNFGTVSQGSRPKLPFVISNVGNQDLNITRLTLTETSDEFFSWAPVTIDDPIAPDESVTVEVTFIADERGDSEGTIRIEHDDPLERPVFIALHGRTPAPVVQVDSEFITFRLAGDSTSQNQEIHIYNIGDLDLQVLGRQFDNPDGTFFIDSEPNYPATVGKNGTLVDGPWAIIDLRFQPAGDTAGDTCSLKFTTDDPETETITVEVVGTYTSNP